jgi:hypothetical protein
MANELNIALAKSGLTVTAQRYQSGAAVGSAISCPETGSTGFYSGNMAGSAGTYQIAFRAAGVNVGSGSIVWSGSAEVPASTFNAASDAVANVTLCATTTTLTNAPSVPSAASIADEVRVELATELARIDAPISGAGNAPSAATVASAVRSELATELARVDAAVSSRATAANIPAADISAIKAKTDALNVDRVNNTATLSQVGNLLAQANS